MPLVRYNYLDRINVLIFSLFLCFLAHGSYSQIHIDSVKTMESSCPNNGSISVYAKSSHPLLYSIVSGPVTQPAQTGNVFNALPKGNYTVKIADGIGNSIAYTTLITGNYIPLDFNPVKTAPYCVGGNNGKIVGNLNSGAGKGPFMWQLIAPSAVTSSPQSHDTFENLPAGNYTMRVTDACGSFRTLVVTLENPNTKMNWYTGNTSIKVGCDSMYIYSLIVLNDIRFPLSFKYRTKNGTFTTLNPTTYDTSLLHGNPRMVRVGQIVPNITYGDNVRVTVENACGDSITTSHTIFPFTFYPKYTYSNCGTVVTPRFDNTMDTYYYDGLKAPVTYSFTDIATNTIVDAGTITATPQEVFTKRIYGVSIKPVEINKTYKLIIRDGCGQTFQQNYTIPAQAGPRIVNKDIVQRIGCLDSVVGTYRIQVSGFTSTPSLIMLSGPSVLGSTQPDFVYTDTYSYPDTIPVGYIGQYFFIENLAMGTYTFKVIDQCGHEVFDSFIIRPADVPSLTKSLSYKKGCLGQNKIYYSTSKATMIVKNISTGAIVRHKEYFNRINTDSVLNVPSGQYEVTFEFEPGSYGDNYLNDHYHSCWVHKDTLMIEGYEIPEIQTGNSIKCKNSFNMVLQPDSSKGVPPYQYEIISGPHTFPVQNSNLFTIHTPGTYTARIYDICGNASIKQFFIDTLAFTPISAVKTCGQVRLIYPSSDYYYYTWTRPDQSVFYGDSLVLDPIVPADTGVYKVTKITDLNGCKDTLHAFYPIAIPNVFTQHKTICPGESVAIGTHLYNQAGTYSDTLNGSNGCDSIVVLQLAFYPSSSLDLGKDTSLCQGQSLAVYAGQGYDFYYWNDDLSVSASAYFNAGQPGKYWVRAEDPYGCIHMDTIEILNVYPLPVVNAGNDTTLCAGKPVQLSASGGHTYTWLPGEEHTTTITVNPSETTRYQVIVYDEHLCSASDEVTVYRIPASSIKILERDSVRHCFEEGAFTIESSSGHNFVWTGITTSSITIYEEGIYSVEVMDAYNCSVVEQLVVQEYCSAKLFVPDAFSPDGNGTNDQFEIFGKYFKNFELTIFNRWGEIIFISTDSDNRWDGTYRGELMPIGTYPWIIHYQHQNENEESHTLRGSVSLIR